MKGIGRILGTAAAAALLLASTGATKGAFAGDAIRVGYLPVTGHAKFFLAKEKGFFAKEGLAVELLEFANSADGLTALRADKIDAGAFGTTAPLTHIDKGADIRIIGGIMGEDAAVVTKAENAASVKRVGDLKGKKVATVRLATGDAVLRGALKEAGVDWRKDLEIFELKNPPAVIEAVKSGQVDAGVVWGPHDLRAEDQGLKVVLRSDVLSPGHPCCRLVVREGQLKSRAKYERFVRAILRAEKFAAENRKETVAAIVKYVKLDPALIEKAYYQGHLDQSSDPNVKGVRRFWDTMQNADMVASKGEVDRFIDTAVYKAALDSLVRESPKEPYWQKLRKQFAERDAKS
jgi:NitT/TauT family transport system substrate-binding protein